MLGMLAPAIVSVVCRFEVVLKGAGDEGGELRLKIQLGGEACSTLRRVGVRPEGAPADLAVQTMYQEFALIPVS